MKSRFFGVALGGLLFAAVAFAQNLTPDQLNALKNLPQDQQDALMQGAQGIQGRGDGSGKKTDAKLSTPQTVTPPADTSGKLREIKTRDGRVLRMPDQDPELRPDDTVLIDLTPIDETTKEEAERALQKQSLSNGLNGGLGQSNPNGVNGAIGPNGAINPAGSINIAGATGGIGASGNARNGNQNGVSATNDYGRIQSDRKAKTDEEKAKIEERRTRILKNNPYRLNHFGVLEAPGLPAIPLAGLTAEEATDRVSADPDLRDFIVKVTLLRLEPFDETSVKPFGYDLFEGVPSTFAPVSDIQVAGRLHDWRPGDTMNVQLYGNEPGTYELSVGRDGRINFPKLGPVSRQRNVL